MFPELFRIGPVFVGSYGVLMALGFLACWVVARWYLPRHGIDRDLSVDLLLAAAIGGIVGARALYVANEWAQFSDRPLQIFMLQRGGLVFYGGLAGGALAVLAYTLVRRLPVPVVADTAALTVPLGSALGRVGCFLNGCCAGQRTSAWFGLTFDPAVGPVVPTQLIDVAAQSFIFFALLHVAVRHRPRAGILWWAYLVLYGVARFSVEIIRVNPRIALGLSEAQLISIPVFAAGVIGMTWMLLRYRGQATAAVIEDGTADGGSEARTAGADA